MASQPDYAFWDDGEWVTWDEANRYIEEQDRRERYPGADFGVISIFENLLHTAREYHDLTGRHLQIYGDIGELFGVISHGLKLHRNYAQGSDGRIGNDLVEVKTITPFKRNDRVVRNLARNFSKVLVVKIDQDFEIAGKLIGRKALPRTRGNRMALDWADLQPAP